MTTTTAPKPAFRFHPPLWGAAVALLGLPAIAMLLTNEVNWDGYDFAVFGLILAGFCLAVEAAWHWLDAPRWRLGAVLLTVLVFGTVWVHLAINLFD